MPRISVTIITLNEEANIGECLESVKWADEIVVLDSGSSDRTLEICAEYGVKVHSDKWHGFGKQKNLCQERASSEWILNLDADERVTSSLKEEILEAVSRGDKDGYFIPRKNFIGGHWIKRCWYPDYTLRLYKKERGAHREQALHASVALNGRTGYLKNPLIHYSYKDITDYIARIPRYSTQGALDAAAEGRRAGLKGLVVRPLYAFIKMYILKRGFLDGRMGLVLSVLFAFYTFSKYAKLWELESSKKD